MELPCYCQVADEIAIPPRAADVKRRPQCKVVRIGHVGYRAVTSTKLVGTPGVCQSPRGTCTRRQDVESHWANT